MSGPVAVTLRHEEKNGPFQALEAVPRCVAHCPKTLRPPTLNLVAIILLDTVFLLGSYTGLAVLDQSDTGYVVV